MADTNGNVGICSWEEAEITVHKTYGQDVNVVGFIQFAVKTGSDEVKGSYFGSFMWPFVAKICGPLLSQYYRDLRLEENVDLLRRSKVITYWLYAPQPAIFLAIDAFVQATKTCVDETTFVPLPMGLHEKDDIRMVPPLVLSACPGG